MSTIPHSSTWSSSSPHPHQYLQFPKDPSERQRRPNLTLRVCVRVCGGGGGVPHKNLYETGLMGKSVFLRGGDVEEVVSGLPLNIMFKLPRGKTKTLSLECML